ncbi:hypothetical protein MmiAt1_07230 [Methanimicrococcus sp. At1]|uniref:DUF5780 domain-containing protein n=1 Tax=Methanimicrococcus hacksteinii TaxID=3028293 RepID=A0ABU3VP70_9EURY|nr:hypothetical protein [Methanimicrococcus sp. At1]MDV0445166.1 hypothetical protein [Methanimicrococcus sp. At1]
MDKIPKILLTFIFVCLILIAAIAGIFIYNSYKASNAPVPNEKELTAYINGHYTENPEILKTAELEDKIGILFKEKNEENSIGVAILHRTNSGSGWYISGSSYGDYVGNWIMVSSSTSGNESYFYLASINCNPRIDSYSYEYISPDNAACERVTEKVEDRTFIKMYEGGIAGEFIYYDKDGNDISQELWETGII